MNRRANNSMTGDCYAAHDGEDFAAALCCKEHMLQGVQALHGL